mmetsp:Transcript_19901/g.28503  ORF Transcript_19901/g.28503 Transcript_19901/m.28503 type:complete len:211 (-) Transcript_19901:105-737(-)
MKALVQIIMQYGVKRAAAAWAEWSSGAAPLGTAAGPGQPPAAKGQEKLLGRMEREGPLVGERAASEAVEGKLLASGCAAGCDWPSSLGPPVPPPPLRSCCCSLSRYPLPRSPASVAASAAADSTSGGDPAARPSAAVAPAVAAAAVGSPRWPAAGFSSSHPVAAWLPPAGSAEPLAAPPRRAACPPGSSWAARLWPGPAPLSPSAAAAAP